MKEALYYNRMEKDNLVQCLLCPHHCAIKIGQSGRCGVRLNDGGALYSLNYGRISSANIDPIEKKPLYHFYPGSRILSVGTLGCNLTCSFCQNSEISQVPRETVSRYFSSMTRESTPQAVADLAEKSRSKGNIGVAYTYNEPSIWYEFVLESAKEVKKRGMKNVLVSNGYLEKEPLLELLEYIDAINIDIKSIDDSFYRKLCGGRVEPVLEYCRTVRNKILLEVTNLIIPGENDSEKNLTELVDWVADTLGRDTPIHFSRYHPDYRFEAPATPVETMAKAYEIGIRKLDYVYVGNIWGSSSWENTRCPNCHQEVIDRSGFQVKDVHIDNGKCTFCGTKLNIAGSFLPVR